MRLFGGRGSKGHGSSSRAELLVEEAIALIERAKVCDDRNDLDQALALYSTGAERLMLSAKVEADATRKQTLLREAAYYLDKAEQIKRIQAPAPAPRRRSRSHGDGALTNLLFGDRGGGSPAPAAAPAGRKHGVARQPPTRHTVVGPASRPAAAALERPHSARSLGRPGSSATAATGSARGGGSSADKHAKELEAVILEDMLDSSPGVRWDAIAGLEAAKQMLQETVILPNLRPDLFTGLRAPSKGVLLYGPPGTGKTMLAKAVATESLFAFFSISASTLTSKYLGEGEKLVRALFRVARARAPAVIFIDEVDALLSRRGREGTEHEASRRLKTEFMVQLDGVCTPPAGDGSSSGGGGAADARLLVLAATNLPQELDEAVLRRFERRIYVPLPDATARAALVARLLQNQRHSLARREMDVIVEATEGFSCSDLTQVCKEAAMQPLRQLGPRIRTARANEIRQISAADFAVAIGTVLPTVSAETVRSYDEWEARSRK
ncbi:unnamed protein product [Phaeothamnion confervicola]